MLKVLFLGDIVGRSGRNLVAEKLVELKSNLSVDLVIANGENSAGGSGITKSIAQDLFDSGIDAITLGDHVWDQKGFENDILDIESLCRPANLPINNPGKSHLIMNVNGVSLGIFTVLGFELYKS